jgi:hypothetical protein
MVLAGEKKLKRCGKGNKKWISVDLWCASPRPPGWVGGEVSGFVMGLLSHNLSISPRNRSSFHIERTSRISSRVLGVLGVGELVVLVLAVTPAIRLLCARTPACAAGLGDGANNRDARARSASADSESDVVYVVD